MFRIIEAKSIKSRIIMYFSILFILVVGLIGILGYTYFSKVLTKEITNYTTKIVNESTANIDSYFTQIKELVQITARNQTIFDSLQYENTTDYSKKLIVYREVYSIFQNTKNFNLKTKDFVIIGNDGFARNYSDAAIIGDYNFFNQDWFPKYKGNLAKVSFVGTHPQDYYLVGKLADENVISIVVPIIDINNPNKGFYGMLLCNLDIDNIESVAKDVALEKTGVILIIDNNNEIIYYPNNYKINEAVKDNLIEQLSGGSGFFEFKNEQADMLTVFSTSKITGWRIVALIPKAEILLHLNDIKFGTITLILICVILVIIISFFISSSIAKPINVLITRMKAISKGDFNIRLYDNSTEEIEVLSKNIDNMIEKINDLNRDIYLYDIKRKESEMKALQSQINPHFLFNTLQSVQALAVCNKTEEIREVIALIGDLLRYAINNSQELVPINLELTYVMSYLQIQNYRYPGKFKYRINCDREVKNFKTLKLILQPIVENSVLHGINERDEGEIIIDVSKVDKGILFCISDNGNGISEEEVDGLMVYINDKSKKDMSSSIGLKNVHERLSLKFGDQYGIQINSEVGRGTRVRILIPEIC